MQWMFPVSAYVCVRVCLLLGTLCLHVVGTAYALDMSLDMFMDCAESGGLCALKGQLVACICQLPVCIQFTLHLCLRLFMLHSHVCEWALLVSHAFCDCLGL